MVRECLCKGGDVGTARGIGNADDPGSVSPQQRMKVEIARVIDQHDIARLDEEAADEIDRMRSGIGQKHLIRCRVDALVPKASCQEAAQITIVALNLEIDLDSTIFCRCSESH